MHFSVAGKQCAYNKIIEIFTVDVGHAVVQLVEVLHYKSEGRGFDS
jgi:hypothetical protein